jgi:7-carboxy-7-deazaguanine synthase
MIVTEIFKSIQGESTFAGLPCIFVRLTGCNLRCHWCDTAYAFHGGTQMMTGEVMARIQELGGNLLEFTGGEPLLQEVEVLALSIDLIEKGYRVLIETSGERYVGRLPRAVVKVVDVKCPASGEDGKFCMDNLAALERKDQIKFVIQDEEDFEFARRFMTENRLSEVVDEILFSPVFGALQPRDLAAWILRDGLHVRMGMQLHKYIWDPEMRGV